MRDITEPSATEVTPPKVESVYGRTAEAAFCYSMVILTVSWVLGPIREFFARAGADPLLPTVAQAVATLLLLTYAAGWVVQTFTVPARLGFRLAVGLGAVGVFVASDVFALRLLFGVGPLDLIAGLANPQGVVIGLTLLVSVVLPMLRGRSVGG
jgi:hypothetical protein